MALLQQPIQRKLSALLGADVTFEKLNLSILSGTIEAVGVTVAGEDRATPVLTIARVKAEVAVARALKGEIVVRSLTIQRPAINVVRRRDGTTNLPKRIKPQADEPAPPSTQSDEGPADEAEKTSWKLDVEKVLVVDGTVDIHLDAFHLAAGRLLAEMKRSGDGYTATLLAENVGRRDVAVDIGTVSGTATIANAADLTALPDAAISAELQIGDVTRMRLHSFRLRAPSDGEISFEGTLPLAKLLALLPPR